MQTKAIVIQPSNRQIELRRANRRMRRQSPSNLPAELKESQLT
jgi:hypothetical protein